MCSLFLPSPTVLFFFFLYTVSSLVSQSFCLKHSWLPNPRLIIILFNSVCVV